MIKGIGSLLLLYVLWDAGYSLAVDKPQPPDETTGVAVEHMVHFHGVRYMDVLMLTNHRPTPVRAAMLEIDGDPVSGGALVTDWRPTALSFLLGGYLLHLIKHEGKMPEAREVYLRPGQTMTVLGKRNLNIARARISLDGDNHEFTFDENSLER